MARQSNPSAALATLATLAALALGLAAAGCGHRGHARPGGHSSFVEVEPNDFVAAANYFGSLAVGETVVVRGYIDDSGYDPFDGFAFTTAEPMDVEFRLTSDHPQADFDLCYYNPYSGLHEACWETADNPEVGLLALGGGRDFHLVVAAYYGASTYELAVIGRPLGYGPAAAAPAAQAAPRAGAVGFEAYGGGAAGAATAARGRPIPAARGRLILVDLGDGAVATQEFELGPDGLRVEGPVGG